MAYTHRFTKSQKSHSLKVSCIFLYKPCIIRRIKPSLFLCVHYVRIIWTPFFLLFQANIIRRSLPLVLKTLVSRWDFWDFQDKTLEFSRIIVPFTSCHSKIEARQFAPLRKSQILNLQSKIRLQPQKVHLSSIIYAVYRTWFIYLLHKSQLAVAHPRACETFLFPLLTKADQK